jgi:hypothetical protein
MLGLIQTWTYRNWYVRKSIKIGEGTAFALKVPLRAENVLELGTSC